jgi:hypothetical protein
MFASPTLTEHLARGIFGFSALAASVALAPEHPWLLLPLLPAAFLALRGCPTCWTVGLAQTVVARLRGRKASGSCADGSCARRG